MTAILKVDTIQDTSGNNIINESSDTITIGASGDTIALAGTTVTGITQGITEADMWRLTADTNAGVGATTVISTNWERVDTDGYEKIGTGLTESSGVFSFPSTGIYLIIASGNVSINSGITNQVFELNTTLDNSSYSLAAVNGTGTGGVTIRGNMGLQFIFDVTNISTHKFRFSTGGMGSANSWIRGNSALNETCFSVTRLGDT